MVLHHRFIVLCRTHIWMTFREFQLFVKELARTKSLDMKLIYNALVSCGSPTLSKVMVRGGKYKAASKVTIFCGSEGLNQTALKVTFGRFSVVGKDLHKTALK